MRPVASDHGAGVKDLCLALRPILYNKYYAVVRGAGDFSTRGGSSEA